MRYSLFLLLVFLGGLVGCATPSTPAGFTPATYGTCTPEIDLTPTANAEVSPSSTPVSTATPIRTTSPHFGYTQIRSNGNRTLDGRGQIPNLTPFDIPLPGPASWVVAVPWAQGSLWVVTLEDGQTLGFQVDAQGWEPTSLPLPNLEPGQPLLLWAGGQSPSLLIPPSVLASPTTHPIPLPGPHLSQAFIDTNGNLVLVDSNLREWSQLEINALPDARILSDEQGRVLLLTSPTEQYGHGVLGDAIEASSITEIDDPVTGEISLLISLPDDLVIEGIAPIWADLTGDGRREIIVTVSNAQQGAQVLVFDANGQQMAAGPAIGQGYRWRHQIAVAPFGPNGELEFVDVLTPHLGGMVEFFRLEGDTLKLVAQVPGYTSHVIGTRNLDMAVAGDFDGDGQIELLLPRQDRTELGAIRRTEAGAEVVWSLPLDGQMSTNLGAVRLPDSSMAIGVGLDNGILRLWHP